MTGKRTFASHPKEARRFSPGDIVLCLGVPRYGEKHDRCRYPRAGELYTVRGYGFPLGIWLHEVVNKPEDFKDLGRIEPAFYQGFFREPTAKELAEAPYGRPAIA